MNFEPLLNSFALVFMGEMGDKTQLLAFSLASRFKRPWVILFGILVATLLNHFLASSLGSWVSQKISKELATLVIGVIFILFGFWSLKPEKSNHFREVGEWGTFVSTVFLFFLAEIGDKTQLATMALAAKYRNIYQVTFGTTLGTLFADGLAIFMGGRLGQLIPMKWIKMIAAALFFIFGSFSLWIFFQIKTAGRP